ncbi:MAG: ABC transporter substrate-binding protein, partial [Pseudomonadota bacterium]|nr:ABC transporter substrate-binding protein [Pseudomonadota bacterium]
RLVSYGARNGKKNIAVLYQNNVAGQLGRNAIQGAATRNGGQVVAAEGYDLNTESLTAAIGRVKSTTSGGAADSLYLTDSWDGGLSVVLQLAPEQGVSPASTQYAGITRWDVRSDGFKLPGIEGAWFAIPDNASTAAFEQRYAARYGAQPHALAGLAFDGVAAVGALLKKGRNDALTRSALTQGAGFQGASGVFRLLNNGTNQRAMGVATVRNQQVVILDPAPRSFGGAGF